MKNLNFIAEELFNKIRGRFPSITIGNEKGEVTNEPKEARFFDFGFKEGERELGKVSITISNESVSIMYNNDFVTNEDSLTKNSWYSFLKEIRVFAKKRMLNFDTRDITKNNLDKRDYKFLATNRPEDITMESKMYGTTRTSYQNIGNARIAIRHSQPVNQELAAGRTQNVNALYIESKEGERFKYPYKHLNGARAMAMHVSEGGKPFDEFGEHIVSLSEELSNLKKFKRYMNRNAVMAESLAEYVGIVNERIQTVKKTIEGLQKEAVYKTMSENFEKVTLEEVPEDVAENWIDQLTIRQFNEELKDVFPYIYRLIAEHTKAEELNFEDLVNPELDTDSQTKTEKVNRAEESFASELEKMMGQFSEEPTDDVVMKKSELPFTEVILSHYDRETGSFPKGETAVLTTIEKDFGDKYIVPSKQFIERLNQTFENFNSFNDLEDEVDLTQEFPTYDQVMGEFNSEVEYNQIVDGFNQDTEFDRIRELAGLDSKKKTS